MAENTGGGAQYVTIKEATAHTGIPERTIRNWVSRGKLAALPSHDDKMVSLADVAILAGTVKRGNHLAMAATSPDDATAHAGNHAELATRPEGTLTEFLDRLRADLDGAYRGQIDAQGALIDELRRRAETAEQEVERLRHIAATMPAMPQTPEPVAVPPPEPRRPWWRRLLER